MYKSNCHVILIRFMYPWLQEVRNNMLGFIILKTQSRWFCKILVKTGLIHLITKFFRYSSRTLQETIDELTDNKDLKAVFSYSFGDYGKHHSIPATRPIIHIWRSSNMNHNI